MMPCGNNDPGAKIQTAQSQIMMSALKQSYCCVFGFTLLKKIFSKGIKTVIRSVFGCRQHMVSIFTFIELNSILVLLVNKIKKSGERLKNEI